MEAAWALTLSSGRGRSSQTGLAIHEALHILAANEGDMVAEALLEELDQPAAMAGFLLPHAFEDFGGGGIVFTKAVGEIAIDALVLFFERDGEGENLTFGEAFEATHICNFDAKVRARAMRKAWPLSVLGSQQMALVDLTKQLAKEALLSATQDPQPRGARGTGPG